MVDSVAHGDPEQPRAKPDRFVIDQPAALRAIAHPLRQQILFELGVRDSGRAADLAQALGEPANSISFHLRTLARAGLIVEAPELAHDRRDRVWRRVADGYEIDHKLPGSSAAVAPMLTWLQRLVDSEHDDRSHSEFSAAPILLTKDEAKQLGAELSAVLQRWHDQTSAAPTGDEPPPERVHYQVLYALGPRRLSGDQPRAGSRAGTDEPPSGLPA